MRSPTLLSGLRLLGAPRLQLLFAGSCIGTRYRHYLNPVIQSLLLWVFTDSGTHCCRSLAS